MMNGVGWVEDDDGTAIFGDRLDAGWVPTIDAPAPDVLEPEMGWPDGTRIIDGRPFLPHHHSRRTVGTPGRSRSPHARTHLLRRAIRGRGAPRGRARATRRSGTASRAGPSDEGEGGGDSAPPPALLDVDQTRPKEVAAAIREAGS